MDPDYIPPPPAYSEQEFDQKISQATALSLHTSQASSNSIDSDEWPQYDPAAFEDTEGSSTSPTTVERSSQFPLERSSGKTDDYMQHGKIASIVPLRIEKKIQPKSLPKPPVISHPRNDSSSTIGENSTPTVFYSETSNRDNFRSQPHSIQSNHVGDNVPLMPSTTASLVQQSSQIAYKKDVSLSSMPSMPAPPPFEAQPPASLPESRPLDNHSYQQYVDPYNESQSPRQSLPIQSRPRFIPQERPMSSYPSSPNSFQSSYIPRLDFNPSVAYGRTQLVTPSLPLKQPVKSVQYDPNSFYNSAVSAQITPITTGQHGHSSYSSYNSRNSVSPQKQYQQQGSPTTYSRPGHYSQSYISHDPLSSERSSALFEMNNSRQPVLQSPARSSSSYSMSSNYQTFNTSPSPVYHYVGHTANVPGNIYYDQQNPENRWSTQ